MKKFIVLLCFCLLILPIQSGCSFSLNSAVKANMSEIRKNVFEAENEKFKVSFMSGQRENPYYYDGVSEKKCDFGIFTVYFKEFVGALKVPFIATINDQKYEGVLEKNPFNESYMVDIERSVSDEDSIMIQIDNNSAISLSNISSSWNISWQDALDIGIKELNEELRSVYIKGVFNGECYLKPITDDNFISGEYFWAFILVNTRFERFTVVFDVNSGEVLVKNKTV